MASPLERPPGARDERSPVRRRVRPAAPASDPEVTPAEQPAPEEPTARPRRPRARRRLSGALLAGAMVGLRDALEDRPDDAEPAVVEAPGAPHDIDNDGVEVDSHDQTFAAPPLDPLPSEARGPHRRRAQR